MSRKAKQVRHCVWACYAAAAAAVLQIGYYLVVGHGASAVPWLLPGLALALACAWALPRGLERFGEGHWLYDWRALGARLRRGR